MRTLPGDLRDPLVADLGEATLELRVVLAALQRPSAVARQLGRLVHRAALDDRCDRQLIRHVQQRALRFFLTHEILQEVRGDSGVPFLQRSQAG